MVPVSTTSEFLVADARAALRRRASEDSRTELSRAFGAWLLRDTNQDSEFASLVREATTREGARQDFHTVAILGFGADACGQRRHGSLRRPAGGSGRPTYAQLGNAGVAG